MICLLLFWRQKNELDRTDERQIEMYKSLIIFSNQRTLDLVQSTVSLPSTGGFTAQ